jgi:catalase
LALRSTGALLRLGAIGVVLVAAIACFVFTAGWLSPDRLTPARFVDEFQQVFGLHPGFRRNHAKGVCIAGSFHSNGRGVRLSRAVVFRSGQVPVIGRFSLAGGNPDVADSPTDVRGMGLSFSLRDGEVWRTAMIDLPVFTVRTAAGFYDQLAAMLPDPATGKPDPANIKAFLARHPESVRAQAVIRSQPVSSGFANATYNGLNAFQFVNAVGTVTPVRWSMVPVDPYAPEPAGDAGQTNKNYLFDAVIARIERGPVEWHLIVTVGQPSDPTDDATIPWPADRERIDTGSLTIDHVETEAPGNCRDINFDPLVLPSGIAPSDDPLLSPRSAVYSRSFTRRAGEPKQPSPVDLSEVRKGS